MNLLTKAITYLRRSLSLSNPQGWAPQSQIAHSGERVSEASALGLTTMVACVRLLSSTVASLPLMVYRKVDGLPQPYSQHPLYTILHDSPNYDQGALDFWEYAQASLELYGNAFAEIIRTGGRVIALRPVPPKDMQVRRVPGGAIEYIYVFEGERRRATESDMLHIRGFGGGPLGGTSVLSLCRHAIGSAIAAQRAADKHFANGVSPSGLLLYDKPLTPQQRTDVEALMREKYVGAVNAGRPMVLDNGVSFQQLSVSAEDTQLLESRRFSVEEICRIFGVPPHMVGHTEKSSSWGTGLDEQTRGFQKYALRPRLRRLEQALMKQLLTPQDRANGVFIEFNVDGLLRGDQKARGAHYERMLRNGVMTVNEVRAKENLAPLPGGDVPRTQMQNVPLASQQSATAEGPQNEEN
jgi:HK97 family phage portal protein